MTDQPWLQEREDFPLGGGKHTFRISVLMRGSGCDWADRLTAVEEKAYNLPDALRQAAERPLGDWFEDQATQYRNEDHEAALAMQRTPPYHDGVQEGRF